MNVEVRRHCMVSLSYSASSLIEKLVSENCLHSSLQSIHQRLTPFCIVEISDIAEVSQVEWNVVFALGNQDNLSSKSMGYAGFIEHIRVSTCAITHDNSRAVNQGNHILYDCSILPNVIGPPAP